MYMIKTQSGDYKVKRIIIEIKMQDLKAWIAFKAEDFDFLLPNNTFDHAVIRDFIKKIYPKAGVSAMWSRSECDTLERIEDRLAQGIISVGYGIPK
jgi:molybdate-binding protein